MLKIVHKGFSVVMAFLVLFSTVYITIESHLCGDVLIDVAVFSKAKECQMAAFEMEQLAISKGNCCKDKLEVLKGQDDLKLTTFENSLFEPHFFITSFLTNYFNLFEGLPEQIIPHKNYSPPNLVADIQVLDQVFII